MKETFQKFAEDKKKIYLLAALAAVIVFLVAVYLFGFFPEFRKKLDVVRYGGTVIEENLVIPNTEKIAGNEGRFVSKGAYETPFVPKSVEERIIVPKAVFTVVNSYDVSINEARKWAEDARPVFIKSLGAVTLEGKSSQWQAVFGSKNKKGRGYEIIVQADKIVSRKEAPSDSAGYDLPKNWYDSGEAIKSLQTLPQFSDATVSSISFYYNLDGKNWGYALATSRGTTSMPVR